MSPFSHCEVRLGQDDFMDTFERCCAATIATGFFVLVVSVAALMIH
jgi:hypothetical protein